VFEDGSKSFTHDLYTLKNGIFDEEEKPGDVLAFEG